MKPGQIRVWRYTLRSGGGLNARSTRREHPGALLRAGEGVGCLHPWPELGDEPLDAQLDSVAAGRPTPLAAAALRAAALDGGARREGRSLFRHPVPESHWLALPGDEPAAVRGQGFRAAKIKISPDACPVGAGLERWAAEGFTLRLDANESFAPGAFLPFWTALPGECRARVELVEDPERWTERGWGELREAGVPLAADREGPERWRPGDWAVLKPARGEWEPPPGTPLLVTSAMDHAVGQAFAAARAAERAAGSGGGGLRGAGLLTHRCFESDPFFDRLVVDGSQLLAPEGTGVGFDDLLERIPWKRLT